MPVHNEKNNAAVRINDSSRVKASVRDRIEAFKDSVFDRKAMIRGAQPAILAPEEAKRQEFPNLGNYNPLGPLRPLLNELGSMQSRERIFPMAAPTGIVMKKVIEDHIGRYEFAREYTEGRRVLDVACGSGYGTAILLNNAISRIGIDINTEAIAYAGSHYYIKGIDTGRLLFTNADAMKFLDSPLSFGTIVSLETITYMEDPMKFLDLIYKSLEPKGTLVLSTPNRIFTDLFYGGIFNSAHKHEFYTYEMASMIENVFGNKPQIFALRPVKKKSLVSSGIRAFLDNNPQIVPVTEEITGINNIFVAKKKGKTGSE
ncbi:MAG: class I SAM-dependent methyltransferase [Candidatus Micrarchaeota archaeon]|nr:class I SAM-dependent methyltransferase [Candidatus Micrarchaeota archaeon]MDE1864994.1 class I SAM-dependent methyltransferase [Candidatus Micrarchaeota archaeon]